MKKRSLLLFAVLPIILSASCSAASPGAPSSPAVTDRESASIIERDSSFGDLESSREPETVESETPGRIPSIEQPSKLEESKLQSSDAINQQPSNSEESPLQSSDVTNEQPSQIEETAPQSSSAPTIPSEPAVPENSSAEQPSEPDVSVPPVSTLPGESSQQEDSSQEEKPVQNIQIIAGNEVFHAVLYDNEAAESLAARLPLTVDMSEMNGNEKYCYLSEGLPAAPSRPSGIHAGDLMLYGSDCLVLFYESFSTSYSYTPLGAVGDPAGLAEALGSGEIQVTFQLG